MWRLRTQPTAWLTGHSVQWHNTYKRARLFYTAMTIKKTGISVHCKSMFLVVDSMRDDLLTLLKELEAVFFSDVSSD